MSRQRVLPSQQQQNQRYPPSGPDYPHSNGHSNGEMSRPRPQQQPQVNHSAIPPQVQMAMQRQQQLEPSSPPRAPRGGRSTPVDVATTSSSRRRDDRDILAAKEEDILKAYGLSSLHPEYWENTNEESMEGGLATPSLAGGRKRGLSVAGKNVLDEPDPLGLYRGSVLSTVGELPPEVTASILLQSKTFDPKTFLKTIHPSATKEDLYHGRERLKQSIESRSGALHRLVEENFDRFIGIKAASSSVYEEMKLGPLSKDGDYSVAELKESLKLAQGRADGVWNPILEARLKADRLRSTLGVFERSKFFFTLPGLLSENIAAGRYDAALVAYKKGKHLLNSRPGALLGLPPGTVMTEQQREKHGRVFEKVWSQVEKTMTDLKMSLISKLKDPRKGLEEVEKTIEIMLELDPTTDPVWIYFDTQHHHILQVLRKSHASATAKYNAVLSKVSEASIQENARALDLQKTVGSFDIGIDVLSDHASGADVWKVLLGMVHNLSEIVLQTMPNFWKVAKGYMEGKYQKKESSREAHKTKSSSQSTNHSTTQVKVMISDITNLYVSLLSDFFKLSSKTNSPKVKQNETLGPPAEPDLPYFMPANANAVTNGQWLLKVLGDLSDTINDIGSLNNLPNECKSSLKDFLNSAKWKFTDCICLSWVRDAKIFYRLEDWVLDTDDTSKTIYLKKIAAYQRNVARLAYRSSGGSEERAMNLFISPGNPMALLRTAKEEPIASNFAGRIHTSYLDALYAFLDGLVHVAFSDPMPLTDGNQASPPTAQSNSKSTSTTLEKSKNPEGLDISDRDVRILVTVSNLSHFKDDFVAKVADQLQTALQIDMKNDRKTLTDVVGQLDKILFDDYIKGRSIPLARVIGNGVLGEGVDWFNAPKPTAVHSYIYDALLSLVLIHAQVTAIAPSLVTRTVGALVEEVAKHALIQFSKVKAFGMGGMLQATLEMEFLHQTLNVHVSNAADSTLQEIYKIISHAYSPPSGGSEASNTNELQKELEQLKLTLTQARRATALQFLCFREKKPVPSSGSSQSSREAIASSGRR